MSQNGYGLEQPVSANQRVSLAFEQIAKPNRSNRTDDLLTPQSLRRAHSSDIARCSAALLFRHWPMRQWRGTVDPRNGGPSEPSPTGAPSKSKLEPTTPSTATTGSTRTGSTKTGSTKTGSARDPEWPQRVGSAALNAAFAGLDSVPHPGCDEVQDRAVYISLAVHADDTQMSVLLRERAMMPMRMLFLYYNTHRVATWLMDGQARMPHGAWSSEFARDGKTEMLHGARSRTLARCLVSHKGELIRWLVGMMSGTPCN